MIRADRAARAAVSLRAADADLRQARAANVRPSGQLAELARLVQALLDSIDHLEELRVRRLWHAEGWRAGFRAGLAEGRRLEAADRDAAWDAIATPIARGGPSHSELERRRWGPGGRAAFGQPRTGDFQGVRS